LRGDSIARVGSVSGDTNPMPDELMGGNLTPYPGTDLRLTIDRTIQAFVEGALDQAIVDYKAAGGTILVMNPRTGEILAVASRPNYEPHRYPEYAQNGEDALFRDPAVSIAYEPGSVFKVVTVAAALDSGRVDLNWSYYDTGELEYGGVPIRTSTGAAYGQQGLQGILDHSLNVGVRRCSDVINPGTWCRSLLQIRARLRFWADHRHRTFRRDTRHRPPPHRLGLVR
jgi:cell division protein FtsI/penicillin-binding protein 2